jgi:hypothetical protein
VRTTPSDAESTIRLLQRNRRARHTKTKELSRAVLEDIDASTPSNNTNNAQEVRNTHLSTCPVCQTEITTGETLSEHVNRCLAEVAASEAFWNEMGAALDSGTHSSQKVISFLFNQTTTSILRMTIGFPHRVHPPRARYQAQAFGENHYEI